MNLKEILKSLKSKLFPLMKCASVYRYFLNSMITAKNRLAFNKSNEYIARLCYFISTFFGSKANDLSV